MEVKLGSIPLRVRGHFFLMALLLGLNERDPARLAIWVAIVLVSVVVHELGHALVGKAFGLTPSIELHGMGGLTYFDGGRASVSTGRSVAISVAGPLAGFVFAFVVFAVQLAVGQPVHPLARHAVTLLFFVNVAWGIFNLLPMLPLDGGNVLRAILGAFTKEKGDKIARVISIAMAVGIGLWAVNRQHWWILYLGVLFAFQNVQALRQDGQMRVDQVFADAIQKGYAALERQDFSETVAILEPVLAGGASSSLRRDALRVYATALVRQGEWSNLMAVIEREHRLLGADELRAYATIFREFGRAQEATRVEELAMAPSPIGEFRA